MWINSVKKRVQNFTGVLFRKARVSECTGRWSRSDRTLGSYVWSVAAERAGIGLRLDAGAESDWTLVGCVRSG